MQAKDACAVDLYPPPPIKWHATVEQHVSIIQDAEERGLWHKQPKAAQKHSRGTSDATTKIGSQDEDMHVLVKGAFAVDPPSDGVRAYRATAFYQSEGLEPRERRKSEPQQAVASEYGRNLQDCKMEARFNLPYNSREQFVKVQILAIADGADLPVGEATIPIADPMAESMNSWRIMQDFEEQGEVSLQILLPGNESGNDSASMDSSVQKSILTEDSELAAKYAAVASKSMVESSLSSSKQDSIDSMVPEPFSDADTPVDNKLQATGSFNPGEKVQVVSKSSGQWVLASIVHVERAQNEVIVQHGELRKVIHLNAPNLAESFLPLGASGSPVLGGFKLGSSAEVFSAKVQRWLIGEVTRLDLGRAEVTVEYEGRVKTVNLNAPELEKYFRKCEPPALGFGAASSPPPPAAGSTGSTGPSAAPPVLRREMTPQMTTAPAVAAPAVAAAAAVAPAAPMYYPNYGPGYGLGIGKPPVAVPYAGQAAGAPLRKAPA